MALSSRPYKSNLRRQPLAVRADGRQAADWPSRSGAVTRRPAARFETANLGPTGGAVNVLLLLHSGRYG
jgi:hypothetical protein